MATELVTFKLRRGTAAQWTTANPILAEGEPGFESNTNRFKIGNGVTNWAGLEYYFSETAIVNMLAASGRLSTPSLAAAYAAKSVETLTLSGRLSDAQLTTKISDQITASGGGGGGGGKVDWVQQNANGTWPAPPTTSALVLVFWKGIAAGVAPTEATTRSTGVMLKGVDVWLRMPA